MEESHTPLDQLISRWLTLHQQGQSLSAEALCENDPEQLEALKRHLREVASMQEFLQFSGESNLPKKTYFNKDDTSDWSDAKNGVSVRDTLESIPGYELLGELGRGGMGVVYKARQLSLKRLVALKMTLSGRHASREQQARFRAEAEAVAKLQHPHIVQIYETGEHDGRPFFAMELVDGPSLATFLQRQPLPPEQAAALVACLADAVHYAHRQGIIHRDLKPANVLLHLPAEIDDRVTRPISGTTTPLCGTPKITDFGLAKQLQDDSGLTQSGAVLGTPSYMAPEQANGNIGLIGPATDVHALGAILYELLTGQPPFHGASVLDTLYQVRNQDPIPPSRLKPKVPRDLEVICLKCLQKETWQRYVSAEALAEDLRAYLAGKAIQARPMGTSERIWRWCRQNPVVASLLVLVALSVLAGMAGILHYAYEADRSARDARIARNNSESARGQAQENAERLRQSLVRQHIAAGDRCFETGQRAQGLWWYARAWEADADQAQNQETHQLRLGFALQNGPELVGLCCHDRPVSMAMFDPSGKTVLTLTDESRAYLWDPFTSRQIVPPLLHDGPVLTAAFSPDGKRIATGSMDGQLRLWDAQTGRLLNAMPQGAAVRSLAWRTQDGLLAVATDAEKVRFYAGATESADHPAITLPAAVYHVAFSPNGRWLVTADAARAARVWEVNTGKAMGGPFPHEDHRADNEHAITYRCWPVYHPKLAALAAVQPQERVTLWDLDKATPRLPPFTCGYQIHQVTFTPNGSHLVANSGNTVNLFPLGLWGKKQAFVHPREVQHVCVHPTEELLASCSTGGKIHLWDLNQGTELFQPLQCAAGVMSLAFSPDGRHLLAASHDGTARVWRLRGTTLLRPHTLDDGQADRMDFTLQHGQRIAYSPDGSLELRCQVAGGVFLCRRGVAGPGLVVQHPGPVTFARFSPDGRSVVTQDTKGILRGWSAATGKPTSFLIRLDRALQSLDFSADGRRLLTIEKRAVNRSLGRVVTVWDMESGKPLLGPLRRWDTGPLRFGEPGFLHQPSRAALSPDGNTLILASDSTGTLGVWDVNTGQELRRHVGYHGVLYSIQFSRDGTKFLTHGSDTVARLWHVATLEPAGPPLRHTSFCRGTDLAPGGWRVATVDSDAVLRLWDGRTGELFGRFDLPPESSTDIWFTRDGRRVVVDGGRQVLALPAYKADRQQFAVLLRLLTGLQPEQTDTLGPIDPSAFAADLPLYQKAWRTWRELQEKHIP